MKVGTINYSTHSGLGVLTKEFYDNKVITDILVVEHQTLPNHHNIWYPSSQTISTLSPDFAVLESFIKSIDVLLLFETPFFPETTQLARKYNKPIAIMPMYEFSEFPLDADLFIVPSQLDYDYYKSMYPDHMIILLPVPTNSNIKWELKEKALTFMHNGGNGSHFDRNGTQKLIEAIPYIKSPCKIKIKAQPQKVTLPKVLDPRIEIINEDLPFDKLWDDVDVFIFVERFNGLSLPLQEAYAKGCLVIAGDRYPINTWLPNKPLVKPIRYEEYSFNKNIPFNAASYNPKDIANKIDEFYGKDITKYSLAGKAWAESNSWRYLKSRYLNLIESLI
jgi:hypothetical protein